MPSDSPSNDNPADDAAAIPEAEPLAEESLGDAEEYSEGSSVPPGGTAEQLIEEATANMRRARAAMSLVHKEHFALLFANCLFFAGSLAAWSRAAYGAHAASGELQTGLGTIRGAGIFALSIYGFWVLGVGLYTKRTVVWPFLINAIVGLWVGLGGVVKGWGSPAWEYAKAELQKTTKTAMDDALVPLGTIAPGFWLLAAGSLLVVFLIVKGIVGGAAKARQTAAEGGGRSR